MLLVNKPFLPGKLEYSKLIESIWDNFWLTNQGPLVKELESKLKSHLGVQNVHYVSNGTLALNLAIKALDLKGEIITTPFSFVATTTSVIWENCNPVYVDILPDTLCINPNKIEAAITEETSAILATHVYGIPCDVEKIEQIAKKHNLKVIYDAAHAFGVQYKGKSILSYGDISTISFHATKVFHTVEGGGIVNNLGPEIDDKIKLLRNFGFEGEDYQLVGINAKNSEFHAAMGLANLNYIESNLEKRKYLFRKYNEILGNAIERPAIRNEVKYNYPYYPIIFKSENELLRIKSELEYREIQSRRYFTPSLNELPYVTYKKCPLSESYSKRVLCLPFYADLKEEDALKIGSIVKELLQ
ncbi:DegT/DnrJ/EryC1/StrS family aminotransferase [Lysinibacillus fusiformis]|uniref:dTDP-4-amino-4,6-dideoxygalactose transaminase n=1 Tax=Lysinibacillus fusiformis TaxID=28031 RepID=A0A1H9M1A4_9BACI|nr:DegT/DnrJ/EryC1/StrS family aminotransferase [Lysinibacillus fusiformis]SCY58458.1 dTDP-4-amino-4,6-dideoxygalactose transaminase [Lysinibacillus fusiformis]SEO15726.1 dTDP-4-amino-4,6-dideoxygalactose transaminase [Lysinibacillus fusiformis]SER17452.1 dTDP-4-amino-4,6-dideoxygalactose transaminase [Lysinibacillus fusiformis]